MGLLKPIHAVLTGDIVNSTQLSPEIEKALLEELKKALSSHLIEFYRGDSFQAYIKEPAVSLRVALLCRALAIKTGVVEEDVSLSDIRISIGIGPVQLPVKTPGTAKGEAFLLSGRRFDELQKTGDRLSIGSGHPVADVALEVMASYLDSIYRGMTVKQAGVIVRLLQGETQQEAASQLNKSKSTVSELASAARWTEIEKIIRQFEKLINQLV